MAKKKINMADAYENWCKTHTDYDPTDFEMYLDWCEQVSRGKIKINK